MASSIPVVPAPSKLQSILMIIQTVLPVLGSVGVPGTAIASALETILQHALALYQSETGQPFDITKIPLEAKLP